MELGEFKIGLEFWCAGKQYRCTDVGSRVVVAIRVDSAEEASRDDVTGEMVTRKMTKAEAEAIGWFNGPTYVCLEQVFDEDDLPICSLEPEDEGD